METNINNESQNINGELNGKEKEKAKAVKSYFDRTWLKKNLKDLAYGFIVIFLFLIVFMVGQMTTYDMIKYVDKVCPGAQIVSASPLNGLSIMPPGSYNVTKLHPEFNFTDNTSNFLNIT